MEAIGVDQVTIRELVSPLTDGDAWQKRELTRHAKLAIEAMGMEHCNTVVTPYATDRDVPGRPRRGQESLQCEVGRKRHRKGGSCSSVAERSSTGQSGTELGPQEATRFRAVTARLNYLAHDRPDIRFAVSGCCTAMAQPTTIDQERLKRVIRYLRYIPRAVFLYKWQE